MLDHAASLSALRNMILGLSVASTGAVSLSATATGYARTAGSFLTDGLAVGMELVASGFGIAGNNQTVTITQVSALAVTCANTAVEVAAGGRTLAVGIPKTQTFDNVVFVAGIGMPYFDEDYLPGPTTLISVGPQGAISATPMYVAKFCVPAGVGYSAAYRYAQAALTLFAPKTAVTLSTGDVLRVRGDTAPFASQLLPIGPGYAMITVSIPLRAYSFNTI